MRVVSVYLDDKTFERLRAAAYEEKKSVSSFVVDAIRAYLTRKEAEDKPAVVVAIKLHLERAIELLNNL